MSFDARDTNHDGKVSLTEKLKDKLHMGHKDTDYAPTHHTTSAAHHTALPATGAALDSRDLNRDGHISMGEKLASGTTGMHTSGLDSRDLNRDGHISSSERLMSGISGTHSTGAFDSRDLNRDGHVSMGEKLAAGSHASAFDSRDLNGDGHISASERLASHGRMAGALETEEEMRLRLHEEQLAISKREVGAGEVDIHKRVLEQHVQQTIPVRREEVIVERRPLSGIASPNARIAAQDETMRVPLFREEIITEKRVVPTEEIIVRKTEVIEQQTVGATLRSEHIEAVQTGMNTSSMVGGIYDARDTNFDGHVSMGEKLKGSALGTPATGMYDARDTNLDGHVSMGEKLKGAPMGTHATGLHDARDTNLDGHVSMGEKLKGATMGTAAPKTAMRG